MIVFVFRLILFLIPGISVKFRKMFRTGIHHQVASLFYPAQLQLNPVQNFQLFIGIPEIEQTAMQPLILSDLRNRRLICRIHIYILGKSPVLPALFQKRQEFYRGITGCQRCIQTGIAIYLFRQGNQLPVLRDSLKKHRNGVRRLGRIRSIQAGSEFLKFQLSGFHLFLYPGLGDHMLFSVKIREDQAGSFPAESLNLVLPDLRPLRCVSNDLLQLLRRQAQVMGKRKEPVYPSGFWFFFQFIFNFLRCLFLPFRQWPGTVDILLIHIQPRIIRVQGGH